MSVYEKEKDFEKGLIGFYKYEYTGKIRIFCDKRLKEKIKKWIFLIYIFFSFPF